MNRMLRAGMICKITERLRMYKIIFVRVAYPCFFRNADSGALQRSRMRIFVWFLFFRPSLAARACLRARVYGFIALKNAANYTSAYIYNCMSVVSRCIVAASNYTPACAFSRLLPKDISGQDFVDCMQLFGGKTEVLHAVQIVLQLLHRAGSHNDRG